MEVLCDAAGYGFRVSCVSSEVVLPDSTHRLHDDVVPFRGVF